MLYSGYSIFINRMFLGNFQMRETVEEMQQLLYLKSILSTFLQTFFLCTFTLPAKKTPEF